MFCNEGLFAMIDQNKFDFIKNKYGYWGSWAIWADEGVRPKSNIGDLSVFEKKENLKKLNPNIILVGLNISRGSIKIPLANFHDARTEATDYKIRYALRNTPLWGAYMTDIIKDYDEKCSKNVIDYLKKNKSFEDQNVSFFLKEVNDIGAVNPIVVAFGTDSYKILKKNLKDDFNIIKIPHYANYTSKEKYREEVISICKASSLKISSHKYKRLKLFSIWVNNFIKNITSKLF